MHSVRNDDNSGRTVGIEGGLDLLNNQTVSVDTRQEMTDITLQEDKSVINTSLGNPMKPLGAYMGDTKVIERQYLVKSGVYSGIVLKGELIDPWVALLGNASIQGFLSRFRYIRANVKVVVMLDTVPSLYGYLAFVPVHSMWTTDYAGHDLMSAPGLVIADVSAREAIEFNLPYRLPTDWVDTLDLNYEQKFPRIMLASGAVATTSTTTAASLSYKVYANFEDVEVAGPRAVAQMHYANAAVAGMATLDKLGTSMINMYEKYSTYLPQAPEVRDEDDKDTVVEPLRLTTYGNMSSTAGQPNTPSLTLTKFNPTSGLLTETAEDMSWKRLLKMQNLHGNNVFTLTEGDEIVLDDRWTYTDGGWFNVVVDSHRFFRGSTKWSLHFFTSPMVSTRVRVSVGWDGATGDPGDLYSDTITLQGSSVHTYQIPHLFSKHWRSSRDLTEYSYNLNVKVISPISSFGDAVPSVYFMAFHSAADDFIVRGFQSPIRPVAEAQMDITSLHQHDFKNVLDVQTAVVDEWETHSVYDALKRFSARLDNDWSLQGNLNLGIPLDAYDYWVSYGARFVRGNVRIKTTLDPTKITTIAMQPSQMSTSGNLNYHAGDGVLIQDASVWPIAEFEVPFMANYTMVNGSNRYTSYLDDGLILADAKRDIGDSFPTFAAIGPHFGMHVLLPPVPTAIRLQIVAAGV